MKIGTKFSKILVPVDGSESDREAIELACRLGKATKGKVLVLYVIQVKRSLPLDASLDSEVRRAETILSHAERIADQSDYDVDTNLIQAREVGPAIVDEAIERGIDLILIGMDYRKHLGGFDLGDVVPYVLKNAPCRVLLLRRPTP